MDQEKKKNNKAEIEELHRVNKQKDEEISSLNRKNDSLMNQISTLEEKIKQNSINDDEKKELKAKLKDSENRNNELNLKLTMMGSQMDDQKNSYEKEIQILTKDNQKLQSALDQKNKQEPISKLQSSKENKEIESRQKTEETKKQDSNNNINSNDNAKDIDLEGKEKENSMKNDNNNNYNNIITGSTEDKAAKLKQNSNIEIKNNVNSSKEKINDDSEANRKQKEKEDSLVICKQENELLKSKLSVLNKEKQELEGKIQKMKETLHEIKNKFDIELSQKLDVRNKIIQEMKKEFTLKEESLLSKLNKTSKEKLELEELLIKQDSKMNDLGNKISQIEVLLKNKNAELKNNEAQANSLIKIIEDQKRQILLFKEEKKNMANFESEIAYLKNYNESLLDDSVAKDEIIRELKQRLTKKSKHGSKQQTALKNNNDEFNDITGVGSNLVIGNKEFNNSGNYKSLLGQNLGSSGEKVFLPKIGNSNSNLNTNNNANAKVSIPENNNIVSNNSQNNVKINNNDSIIDSQKIEKDKTLETQLPNLQQSNNHSNALSNSSHMKAYEEYLKIENEEISKNEENYNRLKEMMKQVLEE